MSTAGGETTDYIDPAGENNNNFGRRFISGTILALVITTLVWYGPFWLTNIVAGSVLSIAHFEFSWIQWYILHRINHPIMLDGVKSDATLITKVFKFTQSERSHQIPMAIIVGLIEAGMSLGILTLLEFTSYQLSIYCFAVHFIHGIALSFQPSKTDALLSLIQLICFTIGMFTNRNQLNLLALNLVSCVMVRIITLGKETPPLTACLRMILDIVGILYLTALMIIVASFTTSITGRQVLMSILFVVWASDTGAYLIGLLLHKIEYQHFHILAPQLSPNKDLEGTIGAIGFSLVGLVLSAQIFGLNGSISDQLIFATTASIVGRVGDLFESALKRAAGIKDSGTIIPGHGGVLDRIDALLFAAIVFTQLRQ